jgi:hypothetical protein
MDVDNAVPAWMILVLIPALVLGLAQLICFVLVVVEMFKRGETGIGIACVVLFFCTGIGGLIAFVYGWIKASPWGLKTVMLIWTGCFVLNCVLVIAAALFGLTFPVRVEAAPAVAALLL